MIVPVTTTSISAAGVGGGGGGGVGRVGVLLPPSPQPNKEQNCGDSEYSFPSEHRSTSCESRWPPLVIGPVAERQRTYRVPAYFHERVLYSAGNRCRIVRCRSAGGTIRQGLLLCQALLIIPFQKGRVLPQDAQAGLRPLAVVIMGSETARSGQPHFIRPTSSFA